MDRNRTGPEGGITVIAWIADDLLVDPSSVGGVPVPVMMGLEVIVSNVPGTDVFVSWSQTSPPAYARH